MSDLMKVEVNSLIKPALDWAVAVADGCGTDVTKMRSGDRWVGPVLIPNAIHPFMGVVLGQKIGRGKHPSHSRYYYPSSVWDHGGYLLTQYRIAITPEYEGQWHADLYAEESQPVARAYGETPLIAACRAIVKAKFGEFVLVPKELMP